jgi:type IV secretory pathway TrbD component
VGREESQETHLGEGPDRQSPTTAEEERRAGIARAESSRGVVVGMAGMSVAVLTFTLVFLTPSGASGLLIEDLFHATLDALILALFTLCFSTFYYSRAILAFEKRSPTAHQLLANGFRLLAIGVGLFTLAPVLVLFSVRLWDVATVGLVAWLLLLVFTLANVREFL